MRDERSKAGGWPEPEIAHKIDTQRALFEHNRADAYSVTMNGMFHVNWTDASLLDKTSGAQPDVRLEVRRVSEN